MNTRIDSLRKYLCEIINTLSTNKNFNINANMLSKNVNNYSLDKIPTSSSVEEDVVGNITYRDVYSFRSRKAYSQDIINNLSNIGFFEKFEYIVNSNNEKGVLPNIEGIESIECLNCGTLLSVDTNTAIFDIQIQIKYIKEV